MPLEHTLLKYSKIFFIMEKWKKKRLTILTAFSILHKNFPKIDN